LKILLSSNTWLQTIGDAVADVGRWCASDGATPRL
jgi:hypothetical protein